MGFLHVGIYNGCYINICEYFDIRYKNKVCTLLLVCDMLSCLLINVYWRYISKHWVGLLIFALSINLLGIIGLYIVPESPEYLYSFYKFKECKEIIQKIAKWNSSKIIDDKTQNSMALRSSNILPLEYKFDVESDLRDIKFNK